MVGATLVLLRIQTRSGGEKQRVLFTANDAHTWMHLPKVLLGPYVETPSGSFSHENDDNEANDKPDNEPYDRHHLREVREPLTRPTRSAVITHVRCGCEDLTTVSASATGVLYLGVQVVNRWASSHFSRPPP